MNSEQGDNITITKEKIKQLYHSFRDGRELSDSWQEEDHTDLSKEAWLALSFEHSRALNEAYSQNVFFINTILKPILSGSVQLSDELYDCLYDWNRDMYLENYDDPDTIYQVSSFLIPHYEQTGNLDYLLFCYQAAGYGALELSRTGDKKTGKESVRLFEHKIGRAHV